MEMLCAFLKSRVSQSESSSSSECCPSPCMLKTALKCTFNSPITGYIYVMHCACTILKITSNNSLILENIWHAIPTIIWSAHCLASMQTALHFGVIVCLVFAIQMWLPFPLECINLETSGQCEISHYVMLPMQTNTSCM